MRTSQGSEATSLRAVDAFIDRNTTDLGNVVTTGARLKLKANITRLSSHASDQTGSTFEYRSSSINKDSLRRALMRDHMAPIASIAKAELPLTPEVAPLRMPRGRPTNAKLAVAAEGMAKAAAPYASLFIDHGMPADFLDQLNAAAEALNASLADHTDIRARRRTATAGVQATIASGRRLVNILDKYVKTALKDNPVLLEGWNNVKRVDRTGQGGNVGTTTSTTTPTPTPAPAPAPATTPAPAPTV